MHHHTHCPHHTACVNEQSRPATKVRLLLTTFVLISSFSLAELAVGLCSHSLALVAESGHMFSDGLALGLAVIAAIVAQISSAKTTATGHRPVEVLAALANGIGLLIVAVWIAKEAIMSLQSPPIEILSLPMLATAIVGFGVNSVNIFLLHKDSHDDLNLRGAFLHVFADAVSSVGVILAAIAVWAMKWMWADAVISLFVSGLIILSAIPLVVQSIKILLASPSSQL